MPPATQTNLRTLQDLDSNCHLTPEKIDQYIDVEIEKQSRNDRRKAALLRGNLAVADALRQRDQDNAELEGQQRAILGTDGVKFLDSIADGMRNDEAKRQLNGLRQAMSSTALTLAYLRFHRRLFRSGR